MRIAWIAAPASLLLAQASFAQDPVQTDGDKYKAIFENDRVRVLEYQDKPGEKTHRHHHPDAVVYALEPFERKLILGDGKVVEVRKKKGETYWVSAQDHIGENTGKTPTHVIIVELKAPAQAARSP